MTGKKFTKIQNALIEQYFAIMIVASSDKEWL